MSIKSFVKPTLEFKNVKNGGDHYILSPEFLLSGKDIMMKGGKFYAVLDPETGFWTTDQARLYEVVDYVLYSYADEKFDKRIYGDEPAYFTKDGGIPVKINTVNNSKNQGLRSLNIWLRDIAPNHNYHALDSDLTFKGDKVDPEDYRSKTLPYKPQKGSIDNYLKLMTTLYSDEERQKLEWAIGSVLAGESKKIEKMIVIFGSPGTGKSTVLDLVDALFEGYSGIFSAADLADRNQQFATALFKDNPLVMIQDDGTLSRIDSPEINMIISHKKTIINEKGKGQYPLTPLAMCFMATNDPVDIRDTNLGISRRVLDIQPTKKTLPVSEYRKAYNGMLRNEIEAIAYHCLEVFEKLGREYYLHYIPKEMIVRTNYLWNFINDEIDFFMENDPVRRDDLFARYKNYVESSGIKFSMNKIEFTSKMKEYYKSFDFSKPIDGKIYKNVFTGFKIEKMYYDEKENDQNIIQPWLQFNCDTSLFDETHRECLAQYEVEDEDVVRPASRWDKVTTKLTDIDTSRVHYILLQGQEIIIDFDYKDENGNKSLEKNYKEALKWLDTYAELSKSGAGIHLHYIYDGDVSELKTRLNDSVEVKVFPPGSKSALRRKLSKCNDIPIARLKDGDLPKKGKKAMINYDAFNSEKALRTFIEKCLKKEHHGATKPEVDFIKKKLDEMYDSGVGYDVSDMRPKIMLFAANSSHQSEACLKLVAKMHFYSDDRSPQEEPDKRTRVFYDVEVFPNLFLVNWKYEGKTDVNRMINPTSSEVENLVMQYALIGFNNRRYDNHILYARMHGYTNEELYHLSKKIISGNTQNAFFGEAYNLSYADVYDFSTKKQSLKKWEIELGIHHQELGLSWDDPVPEEMWPMVAEYCDNDVIATEKVFEKCHGDFVARQILADISGLSVNDTTNAHTQQIIFGKDRNPQSQFVYTDLSKEFPGYKFDNGKSEYWGEDPGEGGYVYAEPGMYENVALLDIASMHPTSIECLNLFGPQYTKNFSAIKQARIYIKHKDFEKAGAMFDGRLQKYLTNADDAKALSYALKIAINSVYGLTSASFPNRCRDPRNVDNIVAKRGALFMINLKHEVQKLGYTVAHIKTDSIKIPNADKKIIKFVTDYGKKYGYTFEHEATYEKMCLVNNAVYIAKYADGDHEFELSTGEKLMTPWTATGAEFQQPYVFKTLFSGDPVVFRDYCITKTVASGELYLDMNEELGDEHDYKFVGRAGSFVPIAQYCGGGELVVKRNEKYSYVSGSKGWRFLEAEDVQTLGKENCIDMEYFKELAEDAVKHLSEFGDVTGFVHYIYTMHEPVEDFMNKPE